MGTPHKVRNSHSIGAKKTAAKILARDPDHYRKIGAKGGKASTGLTGFALNRELAREAGKIGGARSRREYGNITAQEGENNQ